MTVLSSAKATRDAAKSALDERLSLVRGDLAERSVGGRITDKVVGETADVALQAVEVVETHKLIVAGTLATVALWFLRNPIITAVRRLSARIRKRGQGVWSS
jgi:hypothetical protein